jgi:hypothetical protein
MPVSCICAAAGGAFENWSHVPYEDDRRVTQSEAEVRAQLGGWEFARVMAHMR